MSLCPYCHAAQQVNIGQVFCSRHSESFDHLPNALFKIETRELHSDPHISRFAIRFMLEGEMTIHQDGKKRHVGAGQALLFSEHMKYQLDIRSEARASRHVGLAFNPQYVREAAASVMLREEHLLDQKIKLDHPPEIFEHHWMPSAMGAAWLHALDAMDAKTCTLKIEHIQSQVLFWLLTQNTRHIALSPRLENIHKRSTKVEIINRLETARDLIESSAGTLTVTDCASVANLSEFHFIRLFHQAYQESPYRYIQRSRMRAASLLLKETDLPVADIAFRSGYQSPPSFSRVFFGYFGQSPSAYRKSNRE